MTKFGIYMGLTPEAAARRAKEEIAMAKAYHQKIKNAAKQLVETTPLEFVTQRPKHFDARKVLEMNAAEGHACEVIGAIVSAFTEAIEDGKYDPRIADPFHPDNFQDPRDL